jgi:ribosomal protein L24
MMVPASLHYSNVNLLDPNLGVPTKVGTGYLDDGTKVRPA